MSSYNDPLFDLNGQVVAITGAGGVICGAMARELGARGAKIALLDLSQEAAEAVASEIRADGGEAIAVKCNVLDPEAVKAAHQKTIETFGRVDILINGAGGNKKEATTGPDMSFFDIPADALRFVVDLNLLGSVLPSQVFGKGMADRKSGVILNVSSMNSFRPLTKIVGYSVAKAAINNFTQWLAVHIAQNYSHDIRVNAIAPGFFETAQNKFLLRTDSGDLTPRGQQIVDHTPLGRFGEPSDLMGTLIWLLSPGAKFVTGIVVPIDGGFSAYSGV
jgi:NAD(P)-dependent dehydrogenase (short-subunit alcohol dehydrogenase family)